MIKWKRNKPKLYLLNYNRNVWGIYCSHVDPINSEITIQKSNYCNRDDNNTVHLLCGQKRGKIQWNQGRILSFWKIFWFSYCYCNAVKNNGTKMVWRILLHSFQPIILLIQWSLTSFVCEEEIFFSFLYTFKNIAEAMIKSL